MNESWAPVRDKAHAELVEAFMGCKITMQELHVLYRTAKSFVIQYEAITKKREVNPPA